MMLKYWTCDLRLTHRWSIASLPGDGSRVQTVVLVELTDADGVTGLGEASPSRTYAETAAGVAAFCDRVDARRLSFDDVAGSQAYLDHLAPGEMAAKCAFNLALLDGAARHAGKPLCDFLGLGFHEGRHVTSFSIGIDTPDVIRTKVLAAAPYPILKLKVGGAQETANLAALRDAAPVKPVRVDANEGWTTREQALERLAWLARDGHIQFVEQPMPRDTPARDLIWLKERSPLPLLADESYLTVHDLAHCAECFHGVNVKLVKTAGVSAAFDALQAARRAGLKTMLGCMIESSVLITAAAHLAELADYLDLDGNLLITNDPCQGVTAENGVLSFAGAVKPVGLRVSRRA
jgi:L-alanine-DL-glutamate epimerase-like enolase superfamily enzyme